MAPVIPPPLAPFAAPAQSAEITPEQIRAARAALGWTCGELAAKADLVRRTVWSAETGKTPNLNGQRSTLAIRQTLEAAGITFIDTPDGGCGILLNSGAPQ